MKTTTVEDSEFDPKEKEGPGVTGAALNALEEITCDAN